MNKFETITSIVMPLARKDVDTDMIIPAQFLTSVSQEGYGQNLFRRLRDSEANFPMNRSVFASAKILVADDNFGCGSSREHAVWALLGAGIRVVISKSFADIFSSNSSKNGLVLVVLPAKEVDQMLAAAESAEFQITVDLKNQKVVLPDGLEVSFPFNAFRKHCILNGLDDIDYILSHKKEIDAFRHEQNEHRFFSSLTANH